MPDYYFPYIPLMGPDGPMEETDKFNTRYGWMHRVPLKLYYFICDGRVQAETTTLMVHEDKIGDDEYITKEAVMGNEQERVRPGKFKRTLDSIKILVHYTNSDRWFCVKDRDRCIAMGPLSYEMTGKEQTFLALAADPV